MQRIQSKNHEIGTYEINRTFLLLPWWQIFILENGIDAWTLDY